MPVPLIAAGVTAGAGMIQQKMANNAAKKQQMGQQQQQPVAAGAPATGTALEIGQKQSALANTISDFAKRQHSMADPAMSKAMEYYSTLAGGNRGQMQAAIAPQVGQINSSYLGAERGMLSRMAPGAQRDSALADMYRQRAGQIGDLSVGARKEGVQGLAQMGQQMYGNAMSGFGAASGALSGAAGTYGGAAALAQNQNQFDANLQQQKRKGWMDFGGSIGKILLPYVMGKIGNGGGGAKGAGTQMPNMMSLGSI